jgi:hypothetical protein
MTLNIFHQGYFCQLCVSVRVKQQVTDIVTLVPQSDEYLSVLRAAFRKWVFLLYDVNGYKVSIPTVIPGLAAGLQLTWLNDQGAGSSTRIQKWVLYVLLPLPGSQACGWCSDSQATFCARLKAILNTMSVLI